MSTHKNWTKVKTGLWVKVYRCKDHGVDRDCTNGGVSSRVDEIFLLCERGPFWVEEVTDKDQVFYPEERGGGYIAAVPLHQKGWAMFGGNLAYTSDSRCPGPLHIHDRYESQELSDQLSH